MSDKKALEAQDPDYDVRNTKSKKYEDCITLLCNMKALDDG